MKIDVVELLIRKSHTIEIPGIDRKIYGVESAGLIFCQSIGGCNIEHVALLSLDSTNSVINYCIVSIGEINSVRVSLAQLFKVALLSNASKIIVAHNHPSGILSVTERDIEMTKKIAFIANCFEIELIDSLIVSPDKAISIREYCGENKNE